MSHQDPKGSRDYIVDDLKRTLVRIAANERWYEQSWLGVPVWQLPDDLLRLQTVMVEVRPSWVIETGTKYGGSAIFFASILKSLGLDDSGVLTVDIELTPQAANTFEKHTLGSFVQLSLEGDAASLDVVEAFRKHVTRADGPVMVFLDDDHNADHVFEEMMHYADLVTPASYMIVADTVFADLEGTPVGRPTKKYPSVTDSNPRVAVKEFLDSRDDFIIDTRFSHGGIGNFPDGFLKRIKD